MIQYFSQRFVRDRSQNVYWIWGSSRYKINVEDLNFVDRERSRREDPRPPPIVVRFVRQTVRDEIIRLRKLKRDFSTGGSSRYKINVEDLNFVDRERSRREDPRPPPIVVRFVRQTVRDEIIQYLLSLEIRGITANPGETTEGLVCSIGLALGIKLNIEDLNFVDRKRSRREDSRPLPIVVRFVRQTSSARSRLQYALDILSPDSHSTATIFLSLLILEHLSRSGVGGDPLPPYPNVASGCDTTQVTAIKLNIDFQKGVFNITYYGLALTRSQMDLINSCDPSDVKRYLNVVGDPFVLSISRAARHSKKMEIVSTKNKRRNGYEVVFQYGFKTFSGKKPARIRVSTLLKIYGLRDIPTRSGDTEELLIQIDVKEKKHRLRISWPGKFTGLGSSFSAVIQSDAIIIPVHAELLQVRLKGFIALDTSSTSSYQYIFINRKFVQFQFPYSLMNRILSTIFGITTMETLEYLDRQFFKYVLCIECPATYCKIHYGPFIPEIRLKNLTPVVACFNVLYKNIEMMYNLKKMCRYNRQRLGQKFKMTIKDRLEAYRYKLMLILDYSWEQDFEFLIEPIQSLKDNQCFNIDDTSKYLHRLLLTVRTQFGAFRLTIFDEYFETTEEALLQYISNTPTLEVTTALLRTNCVSVHDSTILEVENGLSEMHLEESRNTDSGGGFSTKATIPTLYSDIRTIPKDSFRHMKVVGQLDTKFIICELKEEQGRNETGFIIFDQHGIDERIRLEDFSNNCHYVKKGEDGAYRYKGMGFHQQRRHALAPTRTAVLHC
ncbi:unnamed protein product [Nezara viridula]|uniref:Uncharacterized protein n=1 Tax=Nezara viridula TaxID=85310 RepID=A0A9P0EAV3_NEZVI|nr:unnamed protein product [Nezara viridula]